MFAFSKNNKASTGLTGISLQPDGIAIVQASVEAGQRPHVTACEFRPWDGDAQGKVLARVASDYALKRARCAVTLEDTQYKLLLTEAPDVKPDELRAAVRWRIKELIDFHINDATLDVFDLPGARIPGQTRSMYVVVARTDAIQRHADLMHDADINLQVIDIQELAQRNVASLLAEDQQGVAFLVLNAQGGLLTITKQSELYLSRSLAFGLDILQQNSDNLDAYFDRMALEVQRSLDYFDSHFRQAPLAHLVLAPLPTEIPGLVEYLNNNLNVKTSIMNLTGLVEFEKEIPLTTQVRCLPALGAALRHEQKAL